MEFSEATTAKKAIHMPWSLMVPQYWPNSARFPLMQKQLHAKYWDKMPAATHDGDSYVSYAQERYIYHVKRSSATGLTVLCMADDRAGRMIPSAFLHDIHRIFHKNYGTRDLHTSLAYAMNVEFSRVLSQQMFYYSNNPNATRINQILAEMSEVRHVTVENIEKILQRGEKIVLQVHKTGSLQDNSFKFAKQTSRYKNRIWWRNAKFTTGVVLLLTTLTISLIIFVLLV